MVTELVLVTLLRPAEMVLIIMAADAWTATVRLLERVELKAADVAFLIVLLLIEALLELTVLLETVLLRHLLLLLVGLDDATLVAEVLHVAIEEDVLVELALQRAIIKRYLD